jgi:hypothetical protein
MDQTSTDTIDQQGDPLAFKLRQGRSPLFAARTRDAIKVEARQMAGHQRKPWSPRARREAPSG